MCSMVSKVTATSTLASASGSRVHGAQSNAAFVRLA
jgi:hypothetical protein